MEILAFVIFGAWCIALSISDIRSRRLPDLLTGPGAVGVLGYALCTGRLTGALMGAALLTVPYLLVHLLRPAAFGAGDVKLAVGLGAAAGMHGGQAWVWAAVGAPVLTAVLGAAVLMTSAPIDVRSGSFVTRPAPWSGSDPLWRRSRAPAATTRAGPLTVPHGPSMCLATVLAVGFG